MGLKDKQTVKNTHLIQAMKHAMAGVWTVVRNERNMRYHLVAALFAIGFGWYFRISELEWLMIALAIFFVIASEFANTIAESLVDLIVQHHYDPLAKRVKDVAAGSVLLAALFAVVVAAIIFLPKFF
ncbi:diacylglycerol kinase family protein [Paucilactobacillus suebicus]|uniref:Diacylglycerol kinase n=1 Tax=Paucilactobacillus suebicus DSM 5007 = KCTC 3549 TaxID=1423807 RepID=A0A0R1W2M7_9LACO|nr:diacylglycerol kinase family protein [Paucilactobacillus suebicus]KRM12088.1 diacylglycerol kinase [Paucilactobacillus suebicus DSM 5007 = KCTC 3549]